MKREITINNATMVYDEQAYIDAKEAHGIDAVEMFKTVVSALTPEENEIPMLATCMFNWNLDSDSPSFSVEMKLEKKSK